MFYLNFHEWLDEGVDVVVDVRMQSDIDAFSFRWRVRCVACWLSPRRGQLRSFFCSSLSCWELLYCVPRFCSSLFVLINCLSVASLRPFFFTSDTGSVLHIYYTLYVQRAVDAFTFFTCSMPSLSKLMAADNWRPPPSWRASNYLAREKCPSWVITNVTCALLIALSAAEVDILYAQTCSYWLVVVQNVTR